MKGKNDCCYVKLKTKEFKQRFLVSLLEGSNEFRNPSLLIKPSLLNHPQLFLTHSFNLIPYSVMVHRLILQRLGGVLGAALLLGEATLFLLELRGEGGGFYFLFAGFYFTETISGLFFCLP